MLAKAAERASQEKRKGQGPVFWHKQFHGEAGNVHPDKQEEGCGDNMCARIFSGNLADQGAVTE